MNPTYQTYPAQILTAIFHLPLHIVAVLAICIFTTASTHIFKASGMLYVHSCNCTTKRAPWSREKNLYQQRKLFCCLTFPTSANSADKGLLLVSVTAAQGILLPGLQWLGTWQRYDSHFTLDLPTKHGI